MPGRILKSKWTYLSLIGIALLTGASYAVFLIRASAVEPSEVAEKLKQSASEAGMKLEYQGSRFDYMFGYVLTGVRISDDSGEVFRCSSLLLRITPFSLFRENPVSRLEVFDGQLSVIRPGKLSHSIDSVIRLLGENNLDMHLEGIRLPFEKTDRFLTIDIEPSGKDTARIHGRINSTREGSLVLKGNWSPGKRNRIFINAARTDLTSTMEFLSGETTPENLYRIPFQAGSGLIIANGSVDLEADGMAINLEGGVSGLNGSVFSGTISAADLSGKFRFNAVRSYEDGLLTAELKFESDFLTGSYRFTPDDGQEINVTLEFGKDSTLQFKPAELEGIVETKSKVYYDDRYKRLFWVLNLKGSDLKFTTIPLHIDNLSVQSGKEADYAVHEIRSDGSFRNSPYTYSADGKSRFRTGKEFSIERNTNHVLNISKYSYKQIIKDVIYIHSWMTEKARDPKSTRIEDEGPLWLSEPETHPFYIRYIRNARDKIDLSLKGLTDAGNLPDELKIDAELDPLTFRADLRVPRSEDYTINAYYRASFAGAAPDHQTELTFKARESALNIEPLTGSDTPLRDWNFTARFNALGWYPADMINQSSGQLSFRGYPLDLRKSGRMVIIQRMVAMEDIPSAADLQFFRSTTGTTINLGGIRASDESTGWEAAGAGEYSVHEGGRLNLTFLNNESYKRKRISLRVMPDGRWLPDD